MLKVRKCFFGGYFFNDPLPIFIANKFLDSLLEGAELLVISIISFWCMVYYLILNYYFIFSDYR